MEWCTLHPVIFGYIKGTEPPICRLFTRPFHTEGVGERERERDLDNGDSEGAAVGSLSGRGRRAAPEGFRRSRSASALFSYCLVSSLIVWILIVRWALVGTVHRSVFVLCSSSSTWLIRIGSYDIVRRFCWSPLFILYSWLSGLDQCFRHCRIDGSLFRSCDMIDVICFWVYISCDLRFTLSLSLSSAFFSIGASSFRVDQLSLWIHLRPLKGIDDFPVDPFIFQPELSLIKYLVRYWVGLTSYGQILWSKIYCGTASLSIIFCQTENVFPDDYHFTVQDWLLMHILVLLLPSIFWCLYVGINCRIIGKYDLWNTFTYEIW